MPRGKASGRAAALISAVRANPTLAAVAGEGFLTRLGFGMAGFALPLYALALGMNLAEIGLLYALRTAVTLLARPATGWAADRFGKKPVLGAAVALRCLVGLLYVFATLPWHLYAIRFVSGVMTAAREPSAAALIAVHGDRRRRASAFAWYATARDLGRSLGYASAGLLIQATGDYRVVFGIAFLTSCAALVTVLRWVREGREDVEPAAASAETPVGDGGAAYRGLLRYAAFGLMVAGSAEMMRGLFPVIATEYARLTAGEAGLVAGVSSIAVVLAGPLFGWLSDHVGRRLALSARSAANTISSLLYVVAPNFPGFLVARVVDDTGKAAFRPTWGAVLAEVSDRRPERRGRTVAFVETASSAGEALGPVVAGLLIGAFGVPAMLVVRALLALVTEVQALRLFGPGKAASAQRREVQSSLDQARSLPGEPYSADGPEGPPARDTGVLLEQSAGALDRGRTAAATQERPRELERRGA